MSRESGNQGAAQQALTGLVDAARERFGDDLSARQQAGLMRFEQAVARQVLRSPARPRRALFALGLAAAAAGVTGLMFRRHAEQLTFSVVNGTVSGEGYVWARAARSTELRFSEGSTFTLDPGTSTRVTDIDAHGSRVLLESGRAHVRVAHLPAARWTVEAGPYAVQVVGTEFDVGWSGSKKVLDVQVQRGKIVVRGPLAPSGVTMEAGQHLVANLKDGEMFLYATPGGEAAAAPPARVEPPESPPLLAPAGAAPSLSRGRPVAGRARVSAGTGWSKMVARGDFQGVLADAEQNGLTRTLDTASVDELNALADAARYVRRNDVARRTLLAALDRFPHSGTARDAAFFLGGLAEEESGVAAREAALAWYQRYMAASPGGTYAAHALGRQMILVHHLRGAAAARQIAAAYLQRFPSGPYAAPAKKLLQD